MTREAGIFVDGRSVGDVDIAVLEDGAFGEPPPASYSTTPFGKMPPDMGLPGDRRPTFRGIGHGVGGQGIGPGARHHAATHKLPTFRGRGVAGKHKHIQPHYTKPDGTRAPPPYKGGPMFRPHIQPRGKAPLEKPTHFDLKDIQSAAVGGKKNRIDRSYFKKELEEKPWLAKKMAWMVEGETMGHATREARIAQLETAFNRAYRRGDTLESALKSVTEGGPHGPAGPYYAGSRAPGGGTYAPGKEPSAQAVENFKRDILAPVMAGSDYAKGMSGNASANVAAHQIAKGTPHTDWGREGGDILFDEDRGRRELPRFAGDPVGKTRLVGDPNYHPAVGSGPGQDAASRGVPADVLHGAANLVARGNGAQLQQWMAGQGYPQHGAWCGDFAAAVVHGMGGTPPSGAPVASNWRTWGHHADVPQAGDILSRYGTPIGSTGGHAAVVEGYDPATQTVTIAQGNPARRYSMPLSSVQRQYDIRHADVGDHTAVSTPQRAGENTPHFALKHDISTEGMRPSTNIEDARDRIPDRGRAFINAIGRTETDFNRQVAYEERYNLPEKSSFNPYGNPNVARAGQKGADYGYFQMNQEDVNEAVKLGMSREKAGHLAGGMGVQSSREQQTAAVHEYLSRRYPQQYQKLLAGGSFEEMRKATEGKWHGLANVGKAAEEFEKTLARVHPEAATRPGQGMPAGRALQEARRIAAAQGFDPNKVIVGEKQYVFKIGKGPAEEDKVAAASFTGGDDGKIRIYPKNIAPSHLAGLMAHEIEHAKVERYTLKHGWPSTQEILKATAEPTGPVFRENIGPGTGRGGNLVSDYGQEYLKAIPGGPVFRSRAEPKEGWSSIGPGSGKSDTAQVAINENLAEMARIDFERGHKMYYNRELRELYDKIEAEWKKK